MNNAFINNSVANYALFTSQTSVGHTAKANVNAPKVELSADRQKMGKALEDFEAFFISQSLEQMFAGVKTDGFFGGGNAEKIWRSFLLDEYGKEIARSGGVGIADKMMAHLIQLQEQTSETNEASLETSGLTGAQINTKSISAESDNTESQFKGA